MPSRAVLGTSEPIMLVAMQAVDQAGSAVSSQQHNNFKMVLVNNKPMHSWYNWLTAAGVTEDQVEVIPASFLSLQNQY